MKKQVFNLINDIWMPFGSRLCGRQIPPQFNSSETKLKIRLRTDSDIQGDGFKASLCHYYICRIRFSKLTSYYFIQAKWSSTCGGVFTQSSGKIISPNYPKDYPYDIKCNYTISVPGQEIKLTFNSFELEGNLLLNVIISCKNICYLYYFHIFKNRINNFLKIQELTLPYLCYMIILY